MKNVNVRTIGIALVILILIGVLIWRNKGKKAILPERTVTIEKIDALRFDEIAVNYDTFVLDVHIPEQVHINGTDAFIPYNDLSSHIDQLPEDKNTPILVYCRSGSMSAEAAEELAAMGYTTIYDLAGGINAYKESHVFVLFDPPTHAFGSVIYGDVPTYDFTLTNFTPQPLTVTRVSTSCGCTSADIGDEVISPYDSTRVTVSFDPAVHKDDTDLGDVTRTIYIDTDNPNFPQVTATITATVVKHK